MRVNFESKLDELNENLTNLGEMVKDSLQKAILALENQDLSLANEVVEREPEVNTMSSSLSQDALLLLLREAPVARDFRFVSSAIRMITDLERIGDQAEDIALLVRQMMEVGYEKQELGSIHKMGETTSTMVTDAIEAFVNGDSEQAREAGRMDDQVDELFSKVRKEVISEIRKETLDPHFITDCLMVAKYLERSADHAQNIAEAVVYSITGTNEKFDA